MKVLYRTQATAIGGRNGCAASADRRLRLELSEPRELGGEGGPGTSPEQLFALGYAASLLSAIRDVAAREQVPIAPDSNVTANVAVGTAEDETRLRLAVDLTVDMPATDPETAERLVAEARTRCPFCDATRGNIAVSVTVD